jgi:hypothetical protein
VVGRPPLPITSNKVGEDGGVTVDINDEETITYDRCTVGSNDPTVAASEQFESGCYDIESQVTVDSAADVVHNTVNDSKGPKVSMIVKDVDTATQQQSEVVIPEGIRYFFTSATLSLVGMSLLAFSLTLTIWNTWRAITYTYSPLETSFRLRCILNLCFCAFSILMVICANKGLFGDWGRGIRVLGNVLGGIGLWELIESLVSYLTNSDPAKDLIIYAVWLAICSIVVFVLYKLRGVNIIDSSVLSPV